MTWFIGSARPAAHHTLWGRPPRLSARCMPLNAAASSDESSHAHDRAIPVNGWVVQPSGMRAPWRRSRRRRGWRPPWRAPPTPSVAPATPSGRRAISTWSPRQAAHPEFCNAFATLTLSFKISGVIIEYGIRNINATGTLAVGMPFNSDRQHSHRLCHLNSAHGYRAEILSVIGFT